jgi:hypothetical protein
MGRNPAQCLMSLKTRAIDVLSGGLHDLDAIGTHGGELADPSGHEVDGVVEPIRIEPIIFARVCGDPHWARDVEHDGWTPRQRHEAPRHVVELLMPIAGQIELMSPWAGELSQSERGRSIDDDAHDLVDIGRNRPAECGRTTLDQIDAAHSTLVSGTDTICTGIGYSP